MASKDDNNKKENENQDNITNNRENQYDNNKYSDIVDRDLKERLCYMFKSCNLGHQWDTVLDELILIGELERHEVLEGSDIQTKIIERGKPKTAKEQIAEKFGFKDEGETPPD